jgi:uncharacterized protein YggE
MKQIINFFLLVLFSSLTYSAPELKGSPEELRQFLHPRDKVVTIYGDAKETAYSDKAVVSLVIDTEDKLLSESIANNASLRAEITLNLIGEGLAKDDVKSSKFSTSPQFGWFGKKPNSYRVINRMAIAIMDEAHLQIIAAIADSSEEVTLSDTAFEHTSKNEFEDQVKKDALASVMRQKAFYESSLGVKLTAIGFRNENVLSRATRGASLVEEIVVTSSKIARYDEISENMSAYAESEESSFDEIQYQAGIFVDFKIEQ